LRKYAGFVRITTLEPPEIGMRVTAIALLLPVASFASAGQAQTAEMQVQRAISKMNVAAAQLDADQFMAWYWNSPALTITFDGQTMRGWQHILDEQRKWWSDKNSGIKFAEQRPPEITPQRPDLVTSIQWMTVAAENSKKPSQLVITSVWKKRPEGWRIVLAHESLTP
jgi:ketosteroid isomerase-like protein